MIEKLSDEKIDGCIDAVESKIRNLHGSQTNIKKALKVGMQQARDYYDAQIDKQAKTMEDIKKIVCTHEYDCLSCVEIFVNGFLTAGGTIKDGD
jgi:hypothetical protein